MPVVISEKGSVVIPANLRKKYRLVRGSELVVVDYGGLLALVPAMKRPVRQAAGMLKGSTSLTRTLLAAHKEDRARRRQTARRGRHRGRRVVAPPVTEGLPS